MLIDMSFGNLFKSIRKRNGLTLRKYCIEANMCPGNISKMERGLSNPPKNIEKILFLLKPLKYSKLDLDFLITASQNFYIGKIISNYEKEK